MSDEFPGSFTGPYTDDDIQNRGDQLRDADEYKERSYICPDCGNAHSTSNFPLPYPPRPEDLA